MLKEQLLFLNDKKSSKNSSQKSHTIESKNNKLENLFSELASLGNKVLEDNDKKYHKDKYNLYTHELFYLSLS